MVRLLDGFRFCDDRSSFNFSDRLTPYTPVLSRLRLHRLGAAAITRRRYSAPHSGEQATSCHLNSPNILFRGVASLISLAAHAANLFNRGHR